MVEQVELWQLIRDWLSETTLCGWTVGEHGDTRMIENGEWKFYIGGDYIAGYPSCGKNLIAADPEFFQKLEERLTHVWACNTCKMSLTLDKISLETMLKSPIESADDWQSTYAMVDKCYQKMGKPQPYSTFKIDP